LLSDDGGKTFSEWINLLGGKSVNGNQILFPYDESVPYHLYWDVLNAKEHGVPQNRERVFLVGIRDDSDNAFRFPIEEHLTKRLKDVLEDNIDEKYYISEKMVETFNVHKERHTQKGTGFIFTTKDKNDIANCLRASASICPTDNVLLQVDCKYTYHTCGNSKYGICESCDEGSNYEYLQNENDKSFYRRLTPRECFRLMDFPDSFTWTCSDSQAFKQAGNSIVVNVLYKILKNLNLSISTT
jgi:DNA (cytosine-5)-methyltransferase 1